MKKERKERFWQPFNDEALVNIQKKLNNITNKPKESSDSKTSNEESLSISVLSSNKGDDSGVSISTQISVKQPGGVKKKFWYCPLDGGGQKRKNEKKIFLCTFNDQFKQIFFVGGVIFTEKIRLGNRGRSTLSEDLEVSLSL